MAERKFIYEADGRIARELHVEDPTKADAGFTLNTVEDCEPIVESAKVLREDHKPRGDLKHVARVPVTVVERALREGWFHDQAAWNRWLNDPDNRAFRVWEGRV